VSFPWYIQPIVAVPAFLCADAFQKVLPFCTGFAAGCMIWIVIAEVLPDAFKVTNVWLSRKSKLLNLLFLNYSILQQF
jgi:zinc transporter ZupT